MNNGSVKNLNPLAKVTMLLAFCIVSLIFTSMVAVLVILALNIPEDSRLALQILTFAGQIGGFLIPVVVFIKVFDFSMKQTLHLYKVKPYHLILAIILAAIAIGIISFSGEVNVKALEGRDGIFSTLKKLEDDAALKMEAMLEMKTISALLFNLFLIALVPAICEELLFRGFIQGKLALYFKNSHIAIWISAAVFSAIHMQFFGFLPRLLLGGVFGYLLIYSGSIYLPIMAHFTNNALAVITYYIAENTDYITNEEINNTETEWYFALGSALLVIGILLVIKSTSNWKDRKSDYENLEHFV